MKLTKNVEAEVMQVYDTWLHAYLNGDIKTYDDYLDEEYRFIGSTNNEEFLNRKDTTNFFKATAEQLSGKTEIRNNIRTIQQIGDLVFITDVFDAWFQNESEWAYYGRFRFSSALRKKEKEWRFVYQHFSTPDTKAQEGETIAYEKVADENLQLRDAIRRRTVELEHKNRELEIETALEKVRAEAMGMKKPDDILTICKVMFTELQSLGFSEIRNTLINFWDDDSNSLIDYDYSTDTGGNKAKLSYSSHPVFEQFQKKIKNSQDAFAELIVTEDELESWKQRRRDSGEYEDPRLNDIDALYYYFYSIGIGAIGISTFSSITEEKLNVLKRFRNVFDFAYRRYADVSQAEAQTREAQIEVALEKVRSSSLAMHHSSELEQVAGSLFDRLAELGLSFDGALIFIFDKEKRNISLWIATNHLSAPVKIDLPYDKAVENNTILKDIWNAIGNGEHIISRSYSGEVKNEYFRYVAKYNESKIPEAIRKIQIEQESWTVHLVAEKNSMIGFDSWSGYSTTEEDFKILIRFAKVFEQAYTRFADLQKAEAQAREAQIEAGLERVRSRSLAMHTTSELQEVIHTVHKELLNLNIAISGGSFIAINSEIETELYCWGSGGTANTSEEVHIPLYKKPFCTNLINGIKKGPGFFTEEFTQQEKKNFFNFLFKHEPWSKLDAHQKNETLSSPGGYTRSCCVSLYTSIFIVNHFGVKFSESDNEILKRFAKVFEQAYTRFLDLQKAEAQAREGQIEAALERVRSSSLAMHRSDELQGVVNTVIEQLKELNIELDTTNILIFNKESKNIEFWTGSNSTGKQLTTSWHVSYTDHLLLKEMQQAQQNSHEVFLRYLSFEEKNSFFDYIFTNTDFKDLNAERKKFILESERASILAALVKNIAIQIISYSKKSFLSDEIEILKRFAKVFEQAYTRFLDLQKAEAQAREAEIELALERVRAKTMAMQRSDELVDVATVLFQQVKALGVPQWNCGFNIWNIGDNEFTYYPGSPDGIISPSPCKISLTEHPVFMRFDASRKRGDELLVYEKEGEEQADHYRYMLSLPGVGDLLQSMLDAGFELPKFQIDHLANFAYGNLIFITYRHFPAMHDVFKRFAKVFEQTYTRFLDLQKAEAQTREAQINLAVERVRARALAMYKSEEILELVFKLKQEMMNLDIPNVVAATIHLKEDDGAYTMWDLTAMEATEGQLHQPMVVHYRLENLDPNLFIKKMWDNTAPYFLVVQDEEGFERTIQFLRDHGKTKEADEAEAFLKIAGTKHAYHPTIPLYNGRMCIDLLEPPSDEIELILTKMGAAFDLAYKRFEDLKRSETQLREAQIEAALERVRSRSMAMHKSDELLEAGEILFVEMQKLGIESLTAGYVLFDKEEKNGLNYTPHPGTKKIMPVPVIIPHNETNPMQQVVENWKKGKPFSIIEMNEDETIKHQTFIAERSTNFPLSAAQLIAISPAKLFLHNFYFKEGYILIVGGIKLSAEQTDIMLRFAKVFQQTYTRFLDLQKAEAQAREAQIETALEKVRSSSLAMQTSAELGKVVTVLLKNLHDLGFVAEKGAAAHLIIFSSGTKDFVQWSADPFLDTPVRSRIPFTETPVLSEFFEAKEKGLNFFSKVYSHHLKNEFFRYAFEYSDLKHLPGELKQLILGSETYTHSMAIEENSAISVNSLSANQLSENQTHILKRFAIVFEQAYTRFLDLQKAEEQAREAQIETALERVRSRTMGMQKSDELKEVIQVVYEQFVYLNIHVEHTGFVMDYKTRDDYYIWIADHHGAPSQVVIPYFDSVYYNRFNEAKEKGEEFFVTNLTFEEKNKFYQKLFEYVPGLPEEARKFYFSCPALAASTVLLENVGLYIENFSGIPFTDEENNILMRFGKVFQQTYTRFLDLQKAEAQAREAKIEAALEKARSRTMGMQSSDELPEVANVLFLEVQALGIPAWSCGYNILAEDKTSATCCMSSEGTLQTPFNLRLFGEASFDEMGDFLQSEKTMLVQELGDKALDEHYAYMKSFPDLKPTFDQIDELGLSLPTYQINHLCKFTQGFLLFITYEKVPEAHDIFKRFTKVFEQTYTRFLDLQKAEIQTRQAKIETALEKVRARALAMQLPEELIKVAEVLRHEMGLLGVEELETCSIYIHDEAINRTECWYALKDIRSVEKKLVSDHFPLNLHDTWVGREMEKFYRSDAKQVSILMQGAHRKEWINYCEEKSIPFRGYYGTVIPDRTYHLYKFSHGAIGAASAGDISAESWDLLQRAASVFSLAYSRFKDLTQARFDLQRLKEEKQRAETALSELQTTQKQLIQSEKMASLGELTAGIAHEIQNPLNFVNNFSEVNKELLVELKDEIKKGNLDEVSAIADDVISNEEKINHHGKRADAIVKGMLQHSSSGSGKKESTNINILADEYLRLAYHGLRAKDKSFNASMKTDFDESIGNINIIPQDIGRVILNLITNAFYVVNEKSKQGSANYEPTVTVRTSKNPPSGGRGAEVLISVKDNGNGIPQKILDKIFQPFFTTKPTGQGTGLGLSLSYDIIKAHGGEIKINTKEAEGAEFVVELPY